MTATQIADLEQDFRGFWLKKFIKKAIFAVFGLSLCGIFYFTFVIFDEQNENLKVANADKIDIQKRLEQAKIDAQKAQILSKKRENELKIQASKQTPKPSKIIIKSYDINPKSLKNDFYKRPNLNTALNLARFHLYEQNYEKAIFWSFKANELNKNEPLAWLIFAKAKFALGEKNEARKVVQSYINFYGNRFNEDVSYMLK